MKVVCIDGEFRNYLGVLVTSGVPKEGDIDVVIEDVIRAHNTGKKVRAYRLERFPKNTFDADQFIPVSEIDETEFERNFKTQKVCHCHQE